MTQKAFDQIKEGLDEALLLARRETALNELRKIAGINDPEKAHGLADEVLCNLLRALGYDDVVDAYDAIQPKWYA